MQNQAENETGKRVSDFLMGAIIVVVEEMFFAAKIRATGEALNVPLRFVKKGEDVISAAREENASLVIFDLHNARVDAFELARELKADERFQKTRLLGFFSHVQTELLQKARDAGFAEVMPRSAFTKRLPEILQNA
jgi:CheY-like chemotaxis protein